MSTLLAPLVEAGRALKEARERAAALDGAEGAAPPSLAAVEAHLVIEEARERLTEEAERIVAQLI